jgi:hypothetical protein
MTNPDQLTTTDETETFAEWIARQPRHPFKPDQQPEPDEQEAEREDEAA